MTPPRSHLIRRREPRHAPRGQKPPEPRRASPTAPSSTGPGPPWSRASQGPVLTLFHTGEQPATATIEGYRSRFRNAVHQRELALVQVDPPASADEVLTTTAAPDEADSSCGAHWHPALEALSRLWAHLGWGKTHLWR